MNSKFLIPLSAFLGVCMPSCSSYYRATISAPLPPAAVVRNTNDSVGKFLGVIDRVCSQHSYVQVKRPDIVESDKTVTYLRFYQKKDFEFPVNVYVSISVYLPADRSTMEIVVGGGHAYREMQEIAKIISKELSSKFKDSIFTVKVTSTNSFALNKENREQVPLSCKKRGQA